MEDAFERVEADFVVPEELLKYLERLRRGTRLSRRIPLVTCKDKKNKVTALITFDSEFKRIEKSMSQAKEEFLLRLLGEKCKF
jgi:hypothetical protein